MTTRMLIGAALCGFTAAASAQSATVDVTASSMTAAPGATVTITVDSTFSVSGAGGGLFGTAGFYGFGGDVVAGGTAAATGEAPTINGMLTFGTTASAGTAPSVARAAAGRGFDGGLAGSPVELMTFDVTIDEAAVEGDTLDLTFEGAVVLVVNSELQTFATTPGLNQGMLVSNPVTITVGSGMPGCNLADVAEPYNILDLTDITTFITAFGAQDPIADIDGSGIYDLTDITSFVTLFSGGCP